MTYQSLLQLPIYILVVSHICKKSSNLEIDTCVQSGAIPQRVSDKILTINTKQTKFSLLFAAASDSQFLSPGATRLIS